MQASDCLLHSKLFDLTSDVRYVSSYTYPTTYVQRSLTPVQGYVQATSTFSTLTLPSSLTGLKHKFLGGVLAPNGNMYSVPCNSDSIGIFNPSTGAFSLIDISTVIAHDYKWGAGSRRTHFLRALQCRQHRRLQPLNSRLFHH
jgi:hypothetical protein